jgi:leucyl-tRNA synthetase
VQRSCSGSVPPQYNPAEVEAKWQRYWKELSLEKEVDNTLKNDQKKFYALSMFPYPSGRLHMGHVRVYTITDCIARYQRLKGLKVLHPMGWDAFGLPAENAAIERGIHPAQWTKDNISHMRGQLESLGFDFDWNREVLTCSPEYYRWTQWLFLQLYKHGLAYRKKAWVNWDPVDQTVLANEQVDNNGCSWRSGAKVEQRQMEQWFLKLSSYAESLLQGLDALNWPTSVKQLQSEYIGKSEGVYFEFKLQGLSLPPLKVFTTKPEVVFGATFVAISPDHELLRSSELFEDTILQEIGKCFHDKRNFDQVEGMDLGLKAINPFTGEAVPVYVANFVLSNYGTGAIMGVPGHSQKDEAFALRHSLPVKQVIDKENSLLVNSGQFSGMSVGDASKAILQEAVAGGFGGTSTQYKLSDWLISRQRYWGAPIPILYCDKCGVGMYIK